MTLFAEEFSPTPYWWDRTPRPGGFDNPLPGSADVLVVGSGYTGLHAAIQTATGGRHTIVVDTEDAGWGCSSRNGGQLSTSIKPDYGELKAQYGHDKAIAILNEGRKSLKFLESFIMDNAIDCDFRKTGRFHAAHIPAALDAMRKQIDEMPAELENGAYAVGPDEQHAEIRSAYYHGGVVYPEHACLDPARYHQGLLEVARSAGTEIVSHCKVQDIERNGDGFSVQTSKGVVSARDVVVCTSGYTGAATAWQQKRIIPIGSYMIATEELPEGLTAELIPGGRVVSDTRKLVVYYRASPDRKRILFGGRASLRETDPHKSAPMVRDLMVHRFPELVSAKISHSWMGFVGYTFDKLPHLGKHDGIHYSMGYCGSGINLASYLGAKIGLRVLGDEAGNTALDDLPFQDRFYYGGNPWFLAPSIYYYRWQDERGTGGARLRGS